MRWRLRNTDRLAAAGTINEKPSYYFHKQYDGKGIF